MERAVKKITALVLLIVMLANMCPATVLALDEPEMMYTVYLNESVDSDEGTATVERSQYVEGETVKLQIVPQEGYESEAVEVKTSSEVLVKGTEKEEGYEFKMPAEDCTVTVLWKAKLQEQAEERTSEQELPAVSDQEQTDNVDLMESGITDQEQSMTKETEKKQDHLQNKKEEEKTQVEEESEKTQSEEESKEIPEGVAFLTDEDEDQGKTIVTRGTARGTGIEYWGQVSYMGTTVGAFTIDGNIGFCMEHQKPTPDTGEPFGEQIYNDPNIRKVLYYGWAGTEQWAGFGSYEQGVVCTSLALSYYYSGEDTMGMAAHGTSAQAIGLSDFFYFLDSMPEIGNSDMSLSANHSESHLSDDKTYQRTGNITFQASASNTIYFPLPDGVQLVNLTTGVTDGGIVPVNGGETFYLKAPLTMSGSWSSGALSGSMGKFNAVLCTTGSPELQNLGYGQWATDPANTVELTVKWSSGVGQICIQKVDAETGKTTPQAGSSFLGAVYGVYTDAKCSVPAKDTNGTVVKLTTDGNGQACSGTMAFGKYYLKELTAPKGYLLSEEILSATLPGTKDPLKVTVNAKETPQKGRIELQKQDSETNKAEAQDNSTLGGAEYTITNAAGKVVETLVTDGKGAAKSKDLPLGSYVVKETKNPKGYLLDSKSYSVNITAENSKDTVFTHKVTSKEVPQKGRIELQKVDSETNKAEVQDNATFSGAEYTITNVAGKVVETLVTDGKGAARSKELPLGSYVVKETKNPVGYLKDTKSYTVNLTSDNRTEKVFTKQVTSKEVPQKGMIELQKQDSETNKNEAQGEASFGGAEYTITNASGKVVETLVTNGKGSAKSGKLPLGKYEIKESKNPEGYLMDETVYSVNLTSENRTEEVFVKKVTSKEDIIRGDFEIIKFRESDAEIKKPLKGVEFTLTNQTTKEKVVIVTDKNGKATTIDTEKYPRGRLIFGEWLVEETKTPAGLKPITPFKIKITEQNEVKSYIAEDKRITGAIQLVKVDSSTGKQIPRKNIEFKIVNKDTGKDVEFTQYYPSIEKFTVLKTDDNGQCMLPEKLDYGVYQLFELHAPEGYLLNTDPIEFSVDKAYDWSEPIVVKKENENAMGQIHITKKDAETGELLDGAEYEVRAKEDIITPDHTLRAAKGEVVDTIKTTNGTGSSKKLYLGKYEIKESKAPAGFALSSKVYEVELKYKDQNTALVTESISAEDFPVKIVIQKSTVEEEDALEGVTFAFWNVLDEPGEEAVDPEFTPYWNLYTTDEAGKIEISHLSAGDYKLQEAESLRGYVLDSTIYEIHVDEKGNISLEDEEYQNLKGQKAFSTSPEKGDPKNQLELQIENDYIKVEISKQDIFDSKELPGAQMQIIDETGEILYEWTSTEKPHRIDKMAPGEYVLREQQAPEGFLIAEEVKFTVTETGEIQSVVMKDEHAKGIIEITKKDAETGGLLDGAMFDVVAKKEIKTVNGTTIVEKGTVVDHVEIIGGTGKTKELYLGEYEIKESKAPKGFALSEKVYDVELEYQDQNTAVVVEGIEAQNYPVKIVIHKSTVGEKDLLKGITFAFWNIVDEPKENEEDPEFTQYKDFYVTDGNGYIEIGNLSAGDYKLQEVKTLSGYVLDPTVYEIHVDEKGNISLADEEYQNLKGQKAFSTSPEKGDPKNQLELQIENDYIKVEISKQDIFDSKELPGAQMQIIDETGEILYEWTSTEKPHRVDKMAPGEYVLREQQAPEGFLIAEEVKFTVTETGEIQSVVMKDEHAKGIIEITKKDAETGGLLDGAVFDVVAKKEIKTVNGTTIVKKGTVVDQVEITGDIGKTKELYLGEYEIKESKAPEGFALSAKVHDVELKYKDQNTALVTESISAEDFPVKVMIQKTAAGEEKPLSGVTFKFWNALKEPTKENVYVTNDKGVIEISHLAVGDYVLQEAKTVDGYVLDDTVYAIHVDEKGNISLMDGEYPNLKKQKSSSSSSEKGDPKNQLELQIENDDTKVHISKTDITGEELPGATLVITDEKGEVVEEWISTTEPKIIEKLKVGQAYTLTETIAPKGFKIAQSITFTIENTGEVQKVHMIDEYSVGSIKPSMPNGSSSGKAMGGVKTGDNTNVIIYLAVLLIAASVITGAYCKMRRRKDEEHKE